MCFSVETWLAAWHWSTFFCFFFCDFNTFQPQKCGEIGISLGWIMGMVVYHGDDELPTNSSPLGEAHTRWDHHHTRKGNKKPMCHGQNMGFIHLPGIQISWVYKSLWKSHPIVPILVHSYFYDGLCSSPTNWIVKNPILIADQPSYINSILTCPNSRSHTSICGLLSCSWETLGSSIA